MKPHTMKRQATTWHGLALLMALGTALPAQAVEVDVNFTGTLVVPPPCVINSDSAITVPFGSNLLAGRINGVNYAQPIHYVLDCVGATSTALRLQFKGEGAGFDTSVLATSTPELGLELRSDNVKLAMNTWLSFSDPARPVLTAVPVKATGSTVSGGAFTAASTLLVDYQ